MMKTTGAFHTDAMFSASWKVPMFVAPSPKNVRATFGWPRYLNDIAAPTAIGMPAPTMALAPMLPLLVSMRCIEPPRPLEPPSERPMSSPKATSGLMPSASASPCPR